MLETRILLFPELPAPRYERLRRGIRFPIFVFVFRFHGQMDVAAGQRDCVSQEIFGSTNRGDVEGTGISS